MYVKGAGSARQDLCGEQRQGKECLDVRDGEGAKGQGGQ